MADPAGVAAEAEYEPNALKKVNEVRLFLPFSLAATWRPTLLT
jgi:hypothetical protein